MKSSSHLSVQFPRAVQTEEYCRRFGQNSGRSLEETGGHQNQICFLRRTTTMTTTLTTTTTATNNKHQQQKLPSTNTITNNNKNIAIFKDVNNLILLPSDICITRARFSYCWLDKSPFSVSCSNSIICTFRIRLLTRDLFSPRICVYARLQMYRCTDVQMAQLAHGIPYQKIWPGVCSAPARMPW